MTERLAGACDTHIHVYDDAFPIAPTTVLRPSNASVADYQAVQEHVGLERVVLVQPTTYGLDNSCQLAAMTELGDRARGVMVVDANTALGELDRLTEVGVKGARFHMLPGGAVGWEHLAPVAERIIPRGWHVQLQLDGHELASRLEQLLPLAEHLVVDHVGRFMPPTAPTSEAFAALLALVDAGAHVKLSAPYESAKDSTHRYDEVSECVAALVAAAPDRMLWASNWPHPGQDDPPSLDDLSVLLDRWLPTDALRRQVLVDNPARLYDF